MCGIKLPKGEVMNNKKAIDFLSNKSIFDLERSKGADCIKFIPERIASYRDNIATYANQISILEDEWDKKNSELNASIICFNFVVFFSICAIFATNACFLAFICFN